MGILQRARFPLVNPSMRIPCRSKLSLVPSSPPYFLTLRVRVYMDLRRIRFLTGTKINPKELAVPGALARLSPPGVANPSDNLKNLSE